MSLTQPLVHLSILYMALERLQINHSDSLFPTLEVCYVD